jgi:hypothetical protein
MLLVYELDDLVSELCSINFATIKSICNYYFMVAYVFAFILFNRYIGSDSSEGLSGVAEAVIRLFGLVLLIPITIVNIIESI